MNKNLLTVHCRKHPDGSVTVYRDSNLTEKVCTYDRWNSMRPDYRHKYLTLNCYRWRIDGGYP